MTQLRTYTYDLRINTTIEVVAPGLVSAERLANEIMNALELTDHARNGTLDMDLKDGLEFMGEEEPLSLDDRLPLSDWQYEVSNGDTKLGFHEWQQHRAEAED